MFLPRIVSHIPRPNLTLGCTLFKGPSASAADTMNLSSWLEDLNLGSFEEALAIIGVEVMTDLR